jgi:menaquinone-dependent protoporphyrinogen oxidase
MTILVAYATRNGSTRDVADAISRSLRASGADVELCAARDIRGPLGHRELIILGAPIYSGRWHRDAHRFLKRHRKELGVIPVAVFGMGPRDPGEEAWQRSRQQLDRALARRDWLKPVTVAVFGGADPPKRARKRRDQRDWAQIGAWGSSLARYAPGPAARRPGRAR